MFVSAVISFAAMLLLLSHLNQTWMRRICGYKAITDILLHGSILYMFWGTSTMGLLQAECSGILFSLWLRTYRYLFGYERLVNWKWTRFSGLHRAAKRESAVEEAKPIKPRLRRV